VKYKFAVILFRKKNLKFSVEYILDFTTPGEEKKKKVEENND